MQIYACSPTLSQISLRNSFGKVVFQILAKIKTTRNKNLLFSRHFETVQHFILFYFILFLCMNKKFSKRRVRLHSCSDVMFFE